MDKSVRNKLVKDQRALLLGASDMTQAITAARALRNEDERSAMARVLETAMVVSFMRPFTGSLRLPESYGQPGPEDAQFFDDIKALRDKVYAHTDESTGRQAGPVTIAPEGQVVNLSWDEAWTPLPRGPLDFFISTCERLKENMQLDAGKAQAILDGEIPLDRWGPV